MSQEVGVRARVWVEPKLGHGLPGGATVTRVLRWLGEAAGDRRELAKAPPSTRAPADKGVDRAQQAHQLLAEAQQQLADNMNTYQALMLLKGVSARWPDLPEAQRAKRTLRQYESQLNGKWRRDDVAEQRRFLIAEARGLDRYASGELPRQYLTQRANMAREAILLWKQVIADGQDDRAVAEARKRLPELKKIVDDT